MFCSASSSSGSAVAVESDSSSSSLLSTTAAGGGGDPGLPLASAADSLLAPLSGGGAVAAAWILTRFFFVRLARREGQSTTYLRTKPTDVCLQGGSPIITASSAARGVVGGSGSGSLERRKGLDDMAADGRGRLWGGGGGRHVAVGGI